MARRPNRAWRKLTLRVRLSLRAIDRQTPDWMKWLTPWGTSLALHGLFLFLLAVLVFTNSNGRTNSQQNMSVRLGGDQLRDDITSLLPSDRSGDPFTTERSSEPPSLSPDPSPDPSHIVNIPTPPKGAEIGDAESEAVPLARAGSNAAKADGMGANHEEGLALNVPFAGRQGSAKARLIRSEGGTAESERAVEQGLDWVVRHQRSDGSWSLNHKPQCKGPGCPADRAAESDAAATGLALLPLLGAGHSHDEKGRYQIPVAKGLHWLIKHQNPQGDFFTGGGGNTHMYSHAIAAMALCESYGLTKDPRLQGPAQRAIEFIVAAQDPNGGGWRYNPGEAGDTSVVGWQMLALRCAHLAGLKVDEQAITRCVKYLDAAATNATKTKYAYQPSNGATPVMTAEALLVRQYLGWSRDQPGLKYGSDLVFEHLMKSPERNIYYWYYATQLLHNSQGPAWKKWNARLRDNLIRMQVGGDGCDRGSWDPHKPVVDRWGAEAGRHFVTTMSLLTLEVYYRYLPLYKSRDKELALPNHAENRAKSAAKQPGG